MKKALQIFLSVVLAALLLCANVTTAYAAPIDTSEASAMVTSDGASTYLTNCSNATFVFSVVDGEAVFSVTYIGRESTFVMAKLWVQVQKKYLGLFWRDVGDEWIGTSEELHGWFTDTIPADGSGTYRANFTLHIVGNTGVVDVIEDTIDCKYS